MGQVNVGGLLFLAVVVFFIGVLARSLFGGKSSPRSVLISGAMLGAGLVALVFGRAIYDATNIKDFLPSGGPGMEALLFYIGIPALIAYFVLKKRTAKRELQASPEVPFQVSITTEPMPQSNAVVNALRGRKLTHSLLIDVKISLKDWERIKKAGLYDATLFEYPSPSSTYEAAGREYHVRDLGLGKTRIDFYNIAQCEEAKETLIKNLHNLKAQIEVHSDKPQTDSFEI